MSYSLAEVTLFGLSISGIRALGRFMTWLFAIVAEPFFEFTFISMMSEVPTFVAGSLECH